MFIELLNRISGGGIIHVGASSGQERFDYQNHNMKVVWVEALPEPFQRLQDNIAGIPNQTAYHYAVLDKDDEEVKMFVTDNNGESSSILPLQGHLQMFPHVHFTGMATVKSITLDTLFKRHGLDPRDFQAMVVDVQGAEIQVLLGAQEVIKHLQFMELEAWDFEAYKGCTLLWEIDSFLSKRGFVEEKNMRVMEGSSTEHWYEVLYSKPKMI